MTGSENALPNAASRDTSLTFDPAVAQVVGGVTIRPGASPEPNGDVLLTIVAPAGSDVGAHPERGERISLAEGGPGIFTATLPHDPNFTGPRTVDVSVNGVPTIDPSLPIIWAGNRPRNFVEVPDHSSGFAELLDVPHGTVGRDVYWSSAADAWRRCIVYTPPGYHRSSSAYPVLYLLNGFSDNELSWVHQGRLPYILDNLIAADKITPFLVVMNNGMTRYPNQRPGVIDDAFQRMLVEDCIPFIERTYRTKTDKWSRAIAGLSMGAYMTNDIGLAHPELFGYLGTFTASMTHETLTMLYDRPYKRVMQPGAFPLDAYRVFFRSTTPAEDHLEYFEADDLLCEKAGATVTGGYRRVLYSPDTSKWNSWRRGLHDFSQLLFASE